MKKTLFLVTLIALLAVAAVPALAKVTKYTFNDVVIDGQTVEIEASVKTTNKTDYSTCSYYTDDYADYLGQYAEPVAAGETADAVHDFCVNNFDNAS